MRQDAKISDVTRLYHIASLYAKSAELKSGHSLKNPAPHPLPLIKMIVPPMTITATPTISAIVAADNEGVVDTGCAPTSKRGVVVGLDEVAADSTGDSTVLGVVGVVVDAGGTGGGMSGASGTVPTLSVGTPTALLVGGDGGGGKGAGDDVLSVRRVFSSDSLMQVSPTHSCLVRALSEVGA